MRRYLLILSCTGLFTMSLSGQCPDRDVLWKRIVYLRDSSSIPPKQQLNELLFRLDDIKSCPNPYDSAYTLLLQRIGWLTSVQKDFAGAIEYTRKSIDIIYAHAGKPGINRKHLIKSYNNLRILYDSLKLSGKAAEATDSCISVALNLNTGYEYAVPLIYSRTQNLFETGDYYRCINYAIIGENINRLNGYQVEHVFLYLIWRINSLIFLNKFDEAEQLLFKSIEEAGLIAYSRYLGTLYSSMANIAEERKNVKLALKYSAQSLFYDKKIKHYDGCSETLNNLGFKLYFQQLRQYDIALSYFKKALHYAYPVNALNILDNIANVYVQKGNYDSAFYYFQKSFDILKPGADEEIFLKNYRAIISDKNAAEYVFGLTLDKADAFQFKYKAFKHNEDIVSAIRIYRVADKLLNEIKSGQSALQSKLFWRSATRRLYENAIAASFIENNYTEAFYFFEKSRAVLLQDQLNELNKISNNDILQEAQLRKKIEQLEIELHKTNISSAANAEIQKESANANQELDKLEQLIKNRNPLYYQSFLDTSITTLQDVRQNLLKDRMGLLELFAGDSAVYSLFVMQDKVYFKSISKTDFEHTIDAYTAYISGLSLLNSRFPDYLATANHLYKLIFGENPLSDGRIIISPDGHYFPFEALITSISPAPVYFLNNHAVSYTYSARYLMNDFNSNATTPSGSFMGVAPVHYSYNTQLSSLDGSNISLEKISNYFSNTFNQAGAQATKNNFQQQFPEYKIIQLYTHASDSSERKEPVIYFADSALYLSELIPERKPLTQLIVLSACETAKGTLYAGEGVFSFNRGFAALGVPSSVTNLWAIDNVSTYKLTELFYKYLSQNLPLDIALQKAKLEYIKNAEGENRLPYYWAAPILVGKTDPITLNKPFPWKYIATGIGLAALTFFCWKKLSRNKPITPTPGTIQTAA